MVRLDRIVRNERSDSVRRSDGSEVRGELPPDAYEDDSMISPFDDDPRRRKIETIAGILAIIAIVLLCIWGSR